MPDLRPTVVDSGSLNEQQGQQGQQEQKPRHNQWHEETTDLPSFYSPRSQPVRDQDDDSKTTKLNRDELSLSGVSLQRHPHQQPHPHPQSQPINSTTSTPPSSSSDAVQPPPPTLLSPAFTPPATPGTATPFGEQPQPRGIPVD